MSPLSADRLLVSVAPDCIGLVRMRGILRRAVVEERRIACAPGPADRPWEGAVQALREVIGQGGPARVTLVLSNRLVRYALVPDDPGVSGREEELALARFHFTRIHGERAKAWSLRLGGAVGATRLASAVDAELPDALRGAFPRTGGARLVSVQPYFMAAFNAVRGALRELGWLVLVEPGRACLALLSPAGWHAVQSLRLDAEGCAQVPGHLEREALRSAPEGPRRAWVHGARLALAGDWRVSQLDDSAFAMARCAG